MLFSILEAPEVPAPAYSSDSPEIVVTKKSWRQTRFRPGWDRFPEPVLPDSNRQSPTNVRRRPTRVIEGYTYQASIKNNGDKTIIMVGWDYIFKNTEQSEPTHHQFYSRVKIEPGKQKDVSRFVPAPPTRTVDARSIGQKMIEEVVINYVEYEDGTKWKSPSSKDPEKSDS